MMLSNRTKTYNDEVKILALSDLHLGHRKTTCDQIIDSFYKTITPSILKDINFFFIAGDLFDRHLALGSTEALEIHAFLGYLIKSAYKYDFELRILEGTPSHDWRQGKLIESLKATLSVKDNRVKYTDVMCIEDHPYLGKILYIPDEWDTNTQAIEDGVRKLLMDNGLDSVDWIIMHGQFDFQPPFMVQNKHFAEFYSYICEQYVICGHIHSPTQNANILIPGSFDRLCHNEEHPKGCWLITQRKNDRIEFIENEYAKTYITLDISGLNPENVIEHCQNKLKDVKNGSHVRFKCKKEDSVVSSIDALKQRFTQFNCTHKLEGSMSRSLEAIEDIRSRSFSVQITSDNVTILVDEKIDELTQDKALKSKSLDILDRYRYGL